MKTAKFDLIISNFIFIGIIFLFYFKFLPIFESTFSKLPSNRIEIIRNRISYVIPVSFVIIALIDFYFLRAFNRLEKEEKEAQLNLKIHPQDPLSKQKIEEIEKRRKNLQQLLAIVFRIFFGLVIGFIVISIISPIYQSIGIF